MSAFKEMLAADIDDVFLDVDEFADVHTVNGKECICIVQGAGVTDKWGGASYDKAYYDDLSKAAITVNIRKSDLDAVPLFGQFVEVDGKEYEVQTAADDAGIVTLTLEMNER